MLYRPTTANKLNSLPKSLTKQKQNQRLLLVLEKIWPTDTTYIAGSILNSLLLPPAGKIKIHYANF